MIVSDFGIAKVAESSVRTQTGVVVGTPPYMSPEQCLGIPLTWSADQYALGIVAYEMLTGAPPFKGASYAVMHGHAEDPVPDILSLRGDCPRDVAAAVMRMLGKRPEDRFASMSTALAALGASRSSVDELVEEHIGQLATPLSGEEGTILVHTPASPVPERGPSTPSAASASRSVAEHAPVVAPEDSERVERRVRGLVRRWVQAWALRERLAAMGRAAGSWVRGTLSRLQAAASGMGAVASSIRGRRGLWILGAGASALVLFLIATIVAQPDDGNPEPRQPAAGPPLAANPSPPVQADTTSTLGGGAEAGQVGPDTLDSQVATNPVLVLHVLPARPTVVAGDSLRLRASVRDDSNRVVANVAIRWSVSPESLATIDPVTGMVRARAAGRATATATTTATEPNLTKGVRVTIAARSSAASAPSDSSRSGNTQPDTTADTTSAAATAEEIDRALTTFVRVLDAGDVARLNQLYLVSTPADESARDALIEIVGKRDFQARRPASLQAGAAVTGDRAWADVVITLTWPRALRSRNREAMPVQAELSRGPAGWHVTGFRITKLPWPPG